MYPFFHQDHKSLLKINSDSPTYLVIAEHYLSIIMVWGPFLGWTVNAKYHFWKTNLGWIGPLLNPRPPNREILSSSQHICVKVSPNYQNPCISPPHPISHSPSNPDPRICLLSSVMALTRVMILTSVFVLQYITEVKKWKKFYLCIALVSKVWYVKDFMKNYHGNCKRLYTPFCMQLHELYVFTKQSGTNRTCMPIAWSLFSFMKFCLSQALFLFVSHTTRLG